MKSIKHIEIAKELIDKYLAGNKGINLMSAAERLSWALSDLYDLERNLKNIINVTDWIFTYNRTSLVKKHE